MIPVPATIISLSSVYLGIKIFMKSGRFQQVPEYVIITYLILAADEL